MGDFILAGILIWLVACVWWGTDLLLRAGRRGKVMGGLVIVLGLAPVLIALRLAG